MVDVGPAAAAELVLPEARDDLIALARVCEHSERWDEMAVAMRRAARLDPALDAPERELLAVAHKNVVTARRAAWRVAASVAQAEERAQTPQAALADGYARLLGAEVLAAARDLARMVETALLPAAGTVEAKAQLEKMRGDYYRYCAEVTDAEADKESAHDAYAAAQDHAQALRPLHPLRLGVALNFAIFFYEIRQAPEKACELARRADEAAVADEDRDAEEGLRREAAFVLRLLHENLMLWSNTQA